MLPDSKRKYERERKCKQRVQSLSEKRVNIERHCSRLTDSDKKQRNKEYVSDHRERKKITVIRQNAINKRWAKKVSERKPDKYKSDIVKIPSSVKKTRFGKKNVSINSVLPSDVNEALDVLVLTIKVLSPTLSDQINSSSTDFGIIIDNHMLQEYKQPQFSNLSSKINIVRKKC